MRSHVIFAVFKRNVTSYFSGVLGYLFIVAFVVAGGFLAFNDRFFAENLATLDQLSASFPLLLLFIIPAITMTAWADERRLGTDELLFTLPATDTEILLGKYGAVKAVYFVALLFSLAHAAMLAWIGDPDWGLILTTYLGYWLAGVALLAIGLLASSLTNSATVAFVLGVVLCAIPVFIDRVPFIGASLKPLAVGEQLKDFTLGVVPTTGVLYFISLAGIALYLNTIMLGRRHWSGKRANGGMGWQFAVRSAAVLIGLISVNYMAAFASVRVDATNEQIYSLSKTTKDILKSIPEDRPVTIQAFVSPEVPQEYVKIRRELVGLLRQLDSAGRQNVSLRYVDVEPFSEDAEEAATYGIDVRTVQSEQNGRFTTNDIYLGLQVASGFDEVVIPFFDQGTAIEYQIARAIGTVSKAERLSVGVLTTDANVMGGFDSTNFRRLPRWRVIDELSKQYRVTEVSPDSPIAQDAFDVLLAVMPSSLTEPQMNHFVEYVRKGGPTLVFDDPVPVFNVGLAPSQPKPSPGGGGGMFGGGGNNGPPKADNGRLTALANTLEIEWASQKVVFDQFNPHPQFANVAPSVLVFMTPKGDNPTAINQESDVTEGLEELIGYYPGKVVPRASSDIKFTPLLATSGNTSGTADWSEVTAPSMFGGVSLNPRYQDFTNVTEEEKTDLYAIAGELTGVEGGDSEDLHVIFVSDADIISDTMFSIQERALYGLRIDNVTFLLNAIDSLAGDPKYNPLRSRRAKFRTLKRVEQATTKFIQDANTKRTEAEEEAEKRLEEAEARVEEVREKIEADTSLDAAAKQQQIRNAVAAEQRRLSQEEAQIEREKSKEIRSVEAATQREVRAIENGIRFWTLILPPIPAILLGAIVLAYRKSTEEQGMPSDRTVST